MIRQYWTVQPSNLVIKYPSAKKSRCPLHITFINRSIRYILDNYFQIVYHETVSSVFALGYRGFLTEA